MIQKSVLQRSFNDVCFNKPGHAGSHGYILTRIIICAVRINLKHLLVSASVDILTPEFQRNLP